MTAAAPTVPAAPTKPEAGVKETIESILIAFILAFIFRCFVVEAFVIPTGSMAPTLMGAHLSYRCPDCGYRFTTSFPDQDDNFNVPADYRKVFSVICPNCGLRLPRTLRDDPANDADVDGSAVKYGDRILVMKYLYLLHPPQRWDVVVFKTPDTPRGNPGDYTINYIKRLIGRPKEHLFVAEGDLYVAPDTGKPVKESDFFVQPKTKAAQDALWRIVYDADYVPVGLPRTYEAANGATFSDPAWRQPWSPGQGSGWSHDKSVQGVSKRQFEFNNRTGSGRLVFDTEAVPNTAPLSDWLAYDQTEMQSARGGQTDSIDLPSYGLTQSIVRPVADLKLSATLDRFDGDGTLRLVVGKADDAEFAAEVSRDVIRLTKKLGNSTRTIGEFARPTFPATISIQNVDYRVAVSVDGHERLATTPADYAPDIDAVIRRAQTGGVGPSGYTRIEGDRCTASLSHLQLWRDVYYRDTDGPIVRGTAIDFPRHVVTLGDNEYFTMGDNSYRSSDGRYWTSDVHLPDENLDVAAGIVPGRFLLGRAFFVYWPAGFRVVPSLPPVVPNFGEMRYIR